MLILDSSIMNIAIPSAKVDLGISDANQQWIITAYTLAFGSLLLLGGRIGDFMGRKKIFIIGLLGFAGASALGGIASTQGLLFASRALQGVFGALLAPAALAIISVTFTVPKERAKAFGVFAPKHSVFSERSLVAAQRLDLSWAASLPNTHHGVGASASILRLPSWQRSWQQNLFMNQRLPAKRNMTFLVL
jgi:sugar phosphate permease